jgi:hypothetical protein
LDILPKHNITVYNIVMRNAMNMIDRIKILNMYILIFSLLFIIQKYTIGLISQFKSITLFHKYYLYEIIFALNAVLIIKFFVKINLSKKN